MPSKNAITIQNAVIRTDKDLFVGAWRTLRTQGIVAVIKKFFIFAAGVFGRFFREYLPLQWMYLLSAGGEIIKTIQGSRMVLDLNDLGISRELALYGFHERNSSAYIKTILSPGMKILEVGANIGYYVLIEARHIGIKGRIYAFEPSPYNMTLLRRNVELNNHANVELYQQAVGTEAGRAQFFVANRSNLSGFIRRDDMQQMYDKGAERVEVDVVRLDDFLRDKAVDFIRMDVEGFEREVVAGAQRILCGARAPRYLFIEIHSELLRRRGCSVEEFIRSLADCGYEVTKSFYRGRGDISVDTTAALLAHPHLQRGYWETFLRHR